MHRNPNGNVISQWPKALRPLGVAMGYLPFSRYVWRKWGFAKTLEYLWLGISVAGKVKYSLTPSLRVARLRSVLEATSSISIPECLITVMTPSRKLGNPANQLGKLLESFRQMTAHPERVEILIKVDDDDDFSFFDQVRRKFPELKLRFFIGPRGGGFEDFHRYFAHLIDRASSSSKAGIFAVDDHMFCRKDWDLEVYEFINEDEIFVLGHVSPESMMTLMLVGECPVPHYGYDDEGAPIFSLKLTDGVRSASHGLENWTSVGNVPCLDTFFASLVHILYEHHNIKIYHQVDQYISGQAGGIAFLKDVRSRDLKRAKELIEFFEPSATQERLEVVDRICQAGLFASSIEAKPSV